MRPQSVYSLLLLLGVADYGARRIAPVRHNKLVGLYTIAGRYSTGNAPKVVAISFFFTTLRL